MSDNIIGKKLDEIKELLDINESGNNSYTENNNQKDAFKQWFSKQKKANGELYKPNVIETYINSFNAAAITFAEYIEPFHSLFEINRADTFNEVFAEIKNAPNYEEFNRARANGSFSACAKLYSKFLDNGKREYELIIKADKVVSSDETFTMDNLGVGDRFKPVDALFVGADGIEVRRIRARGEYKISNMTLPRIAFQIYEKQIIALSEKEKEQFPICRYTLDGEIIRGIFPNEKEFKQQRNTIESLIYNRADDGQFVIYCWNIFSTIIFVQECLKRFGNPGDYFKLIYCEKEELAEDDSVNNEWIIEYGEYETDKVRNRIIFGAPGTGKSYTLEKDKNEWLTEDDSCERVTFHPDYSYANFVGTYKPVPDGTGITYKYVPGPFMRVLVKALENPAKPYLLIIEEINRAQVAAVFGDVFQLMDRNSKGFSEYAIATSEDMRKYLSEKLQINECYLEEIRIPSNMFIWASMNSADQGVFPMDTAFKRRWEFDYIGIDDEEKSLPNTDVANKWNIWRKAINKYLSSKRVNEDKLMGPFFIAKSVMDNNSESDFDNVFKNKVIMYLFEDAGKRCVDLFSGCNDDERKRYSLICNKFDEIGLKIFDKSIWEGIEN